MNKRQLITRVRRLLGPGTTYQSATAAVDAVLGSILATVPRGKVRIPDLGTFEFIDRAPRTAFSIPLSAAKTIPATRKLTFRPASSLLAALDGDTRIHAAGVIGSERRRTAE